MVKRVFLIVLDSMGIGAMPDAARWQDEGSNTLAAIRTHSDFCCPTLARLGLFNIDGVGGGVTTPLASFARMTEASAGKDTTIGHWEIAGIVSPEPLPTYPNGFPSEVITAFERATGRKVLCNRPYSGTDVIRDYGRVHCASGDLIVYTSADSVFQIAAHESVVPVEELYRDCELARGLLQGRHAVGRVIARPFAGEYPYVRTSRRHDFSLQPPKDTIIDLLNRHGYDTVSVGKIYDIFAGRGFSETHPTIGNADGMHRTETLLHSDFHGLCFTNLVDFDMLYGHRNDVAGYARAMSEFDAWLNDFLLQLGTDDLCIVTADHGCDPATPSTDHSREYTPMLIFGSMVKNGINLGTRSTFADIGATVLEALGIEEALSAGSGFWHAVCRSSKTETID